MKHPEKDFEVSDSGMGIPEEELGKITDAFYMVDKSRSRKEGGSGLGLALCVKVAEIHGGCLKIESKQREGTTVRAIFDLQFVYILMNTSAKQYGTLFS